MGSMALSIVISGCSGGPGHIPPGGAYGGACTPQTPDDMKKLLGCPLAQPDRLSPFDRLYLSERPPLAQHVYVIDITGEPYERKVLAASLQGIVNRTSARIYLIDSDTGQNRPWEEDDEEASELFWLNYYEQAYGVDVVWEGSIEDALPLFASYVNGYVLVSETEPWTINAGTTIAGRDGVLVAFQDDQALLGSLGLKMKESLVGKWTDTSDCYTYLYDHYYPTMRHRGIAVLNPEEYRLRDFLIQQGILTVYSRPSLSDWDTVKDIFSGMPPDLPVYGYMSVNGLEEFTAVMTLSQAGKFLVPTDTTPNLSFHVAAVPERPVVYSPATATASPCRHDRLNVTIAISDGDNLAMPVNRYIWSSYWGSGSRGDMPMGWSLSLALKSLAPAIADYYFSTASPDDEIVGMLGIGYAHPSYYSDRAFFFSKSFQRMGELGLDTFWTLDISMDDPDSAIWNDVEENIAGGRPTGFFVGYSDMPIGYFRTPQGIPVLMPINDYEDTPSVLASRLTDILAQPQSAWPPIVFLMASSWTNSMDGLVGDLKPLEAQGVNYLTPSQAFRCVP